ncbi:MAG: LemA family protein [Puniceicoccales bacterium]|nr:LemA family protein [Puniceicoccales bacterium]
MLRDLPTSKVLGVFIGLVELKGSAESAEPLVSYLAGVRCVRYAWRVEESWSRTVTESYRDSDGHTRTRTRHESGWKTVARGGELPDFYLRDDTGMVLVRPHGATVETQIFFRKSVTPADPIYYGKGPSGAVSDSDYRRRFVEEGIALHAPLYVVGTARERADVVAPEIAAGLKKSGEFLISAYSEEKVVSRLGTASWGWFVFGVFMVGLGQFFCVHNRPFATFRLSPPEFFDLYGGMACVIGGYFALWAIGWMWMVYNSLTQLQNRVRQAWSLIDVQLKRRHDLIPSLVSVAAALGGHERVVQETLAALRAQQVASGRGLAGISGVAASLGVLVEHYPQLVAQEGFLRLQRELVETEQRVALARGYYNDIATHFATRLECVPECWIAALGGMKPHPLLAASHFERAAVDVQLSE